MCTTKDNMSFGDIHIISFCSSPSVNVWTNNKSKLQMTQIWPGCGVAKNRCYIWAQSHLVMSVWKLIILKMDSPSMAEFLWDISYLPKDICLFHYQILLCKNLISLQYEYSEIGKKMITEKLGLWSQIHWMFITLSSNCVFVCSVSSIKLLPES